MKLQDLKSLELHTSIIFSKTANVENLKIDTKTSSQIKILYIAVKTTEYGYFVIEDNFTESKSDIFMKRVLRE